MNRDPKGFYRLFRITPDATDDDIRYAYRKLVQRFHPDKWQHPESTRVFQLITDVQQLLLNPARRKQYDPGWRGDFKPLEFRRVNSIKN